METAPAATPSGAAVRGKAPAEASEKEPAGEIMKIAVKAETSAAAETEMPDNRKGDIQMPGFDKTGPWGQGPMSGRGMGPCGRGMARGVGFGRGFGPGRGMGRGFGRGFGRGVGVRADYGDYADYNDPSAGYAAYPQAMAPEAESEALDAQSKRLRAALEAVEARMAELKEPES